MTTSGADRDTVLLYDTTLRDGAQSEGLILSLQDKLRIARALDEFGMPAIEGGWPGSNPKDIEFFAAAKNSMSFGLEPGQPPSIAGIPNSSSARAIRSLSCKERINPSLCAPSRSVVS